MKLSSLSTFYFSLSSLLLICILAVVLLMLRNQNELVYNQEIRYRSYLAADELRQSSDDLTRLARTYVVTRDQRYEEQFWDVLAIRDGQKPRPQDYNRIYWDFIAAGEIPRPAGPALALLAHMQALGFTDQELAKLDEAKQNSDGLVKLESTAMNAVKGLFEDDEGKFTRQGEPNFELARNLMHSADYHRQKAYIMRPLDEFYTLLDERTEQAVAEHVQRGRLYLYLLLSLIGLAILAAVVGHIRIRQRFIRPLRKLGTALKDIAEEPDYDRKNLDSSGHDELADVARYFNMASTRFSDMLEAIHLETNTARQLQQALDASSASIVIADADNRIIYFNHSAQRTLQEIETDIQQSNPEFSAESLQASNWYDLHPDPNARPQLKGLDFRHEETIVYGDFTFRLTANPIVTADGVRHGIIAEWQNITRKAQAERTREIEIEQRKEREINSKVDALLDIVNSAVNGDLTREVCMTGDDVVARMGNGIETLLRELKDNLSHIRSSSSALRLASVTLAETSDEIDNMAIHAADDMSSMTTTSTTMKEDIDAVANAMSQMTMAITHIALNAGEAAEVANQAVELAESTDSTVRQLSDSSASIGNVLKVITSIAEQTNLLALNATIEAARAGEAGKGFAVVANEVKELAKGTAKATEEISKSIEAIQINSGDAVQAITSIGQTIKRISKIQNVIAAAVKEQTASTTEMSLNVHNAAINGDKITENTCSLSAGIHQTKQGVTRLQSTSGDISELAEELRKKVEKFELGDSSEPGL
ncbi:methyl-accepting chemotaxis protein [Granulosicoccus sp. 3-233]|uniref:methyl-accepting chemotaxis protein n=1 Tax=Granulosicoccus sp. 3-233 TaxID=3417969 RepID=UPI003D32BE96